MKKLFVLASIFMIGFSVSAQQNSLDMESRIVLNEINTIGGAQYVELHNPTNSVVDLSCYSLIIQTTTTTAGGLKRGSFAVVDFKDGESIPVNGYYSIGAVATVNATTNQPNTWTGDATVVIYNYTSATTPYYTPNYSFVNTSPLIQDDNSVSNAILLVKNNSLVDALITKASSVTEAQTYLKDSYTLAATISSGSGNTCIGTDFRFDLYSNNLSNRNITQAAGRGAYARNGNGACEAWVKIQDNEATNGIQNPKYSNNVATFLPPTWRITSYTYPLTGTPSSTGALTPSVPPNQNGSLVQGTMASLQETVDRQPNANNVLGVLINLNFGSVDLRGESSLTANLSVYEDGSTSTGWGTLEVESDIQLSSQMVTLITGQTAFATVFVPTPQVSPQSAPYFHITLSTPAGYCPFRVTYQISTAFALPVSLSKMSVRTENQKNKISWTTSTESNNKGFEVQRALGNTNDFKTIGFVGTRAKDGNSQIDISYSFDDANIVSGQIHNYRLKQIDFDGKSSMSPVRSIKPGSIESNLNVYPNPSQGSVTVNTGSASGKLNIYVLDNTGRTVNQYLNVSATNTRISNLKKGLYTLKIVNTETGEQSAQRVVVQ